MDSVGTTRLEGTAIRQIAPGRGSEIEIETAFVRVKQLAIFFLLHHHHKPLGPLVVLIQRIQTHALPGTAKHHRFVLVKQTNGATCGS